MLLLDVESHGFSRADCSTLRRLCSGHRSREMKARGRSADSRKLWGDAVTHSTAFSGLSTLCYIYGLRWWMWAWSEERGASMRWRTAVYGSGFKGHISIRETYQVLTLLDFTQREAVENPCGLDISFPDVDTGLIYVSSKEYHRW